MKLLDQGGSTKNEFGGASFFNAYWDSQNQWVSIVSTPTLPDGADPKSVSDQAIVILVNKSMSATVTGTETPQSLPEPAGPTTTGTQATTTQGGRQGQPATQPAASPATVSSCTLIR